MPTPFDFAVPETNWVPLLPIATVALTGLFALLAEIAWPKRPNDRIIGISVIGLVLAAFLALSQVKYDLFVEGASGLFREDLLGASSQALLCVGTLLTVLFSENYLRAKKIPFGEFYPLVLWSTCGAMVMVTTTNMLMLFLGLEVLSVALYVMAGMARAEEGSNESALKYFLLGAFASGFLLYGIAFIYGATGSLQLTDIQFSWMKSNDSHALILVGLALMLIGFGFKASLVPFHQWTPDVYQGAPTNVTAYMATGSKVAAFVALIRLLEGASALREIYAPMLGVVAVLTMTVGNVMALSQKDVKRTLGYSSIAQAGYVLVAILAHLQDPKKIGTGTVTFYLFAYVLTTIGLFSVVSLAAKPGQAGTKLADLAGMRDRSPLAATALLVFCMSLTGLPFNGGFTGKIRIFIDAQGAGLPWLAIALAINSVISAWYYLGIARAALATDPEGEPVGTPLSLSVTSACVLCLVGVLVAFFAPGILPYFPAR